MADFKLSTEQKAVVDARDCSLLVSAAAGSGKTAVLTKRIIERLKDKNDPTDIDRFLIVTFTKAAAGEMRERIGKALDEALSEDPEDAGLLKQKALLPSATISTIDSFCSSVVKDNYHLLDIDPSFTIADKGVLDLIKQDILDEMLDEEYEKGEDAFKELVAAYATHKDDSNVRQMILMLYGFADSDPRPEEWLKNAEDSLYTLPSVNVLPLIMNDSRRVISECIKLCTEGLRISQGQMGPAEYAVTFSDELTLLNNAGNAQSFDDMKDALDSMIFDKVYVYTSKKMTEAGVDPALKDEAKNLRDKYKKLVTDLREKFFYAAEKQLDSQHMKTVKYGAELIRLTKRFKELYTAELNDRNSYGFSDVAHMAMSVLSEKNGDGEEVPTAIAREMAENYDEIMIDEYQDSNYLQEYALKSVSGEFGGIPNLFMVGDVKQSIYGFRKARPELFMQKYDTFAAEGDHRKIDLFLNFRSKKSILDTVNVILSSVMKRDISDIEYDENAALHYGPDDDGRDLNYVSTEVMLVDKDVEEDDADEEPVLRDNIADSSADESYSAGETTAAEREALAVAHKIKELREGGKAGYKDIAVLVRAMKDYDEAFVKVFGAMDIPVSVESGSGFFDAVEIRKVLSFLRIIDNPYQDIPFAAVLYSAFAGLSAEELAGLKVNYGTDENGYRRMLCSMAREAAKDGNEKLKRFFDLYDELVRKSKYLPVHELIKIMTEEGFKDAVSACPEGDRRAGNIEKLEAIAEQYEKNGCIGLSAFLKVIERLSEEDDSISEARTELKSDSVSLMTIHKSKGLEFPVVFIAGLGNEMNKMEYRKNYIFDQELGIAFNYVDPKRRIKSRGIKQQYIQKKKLLRQNSEEIRVIYVGLTRAKDLLYLVATLDKPEEKIKDRGERISNGVITYGSFASAATLFDFISPKIFENITDGEIESIMAGNRVIRRLSGQCGTESYTADIAVSYTKFNEKKAMDEITGVKKDEGDKKAPEGDDKEFTPEEAAELVLAPYAEEIEKRRNFAYPFREIAEAPSKVSVSGLKLLAMKDSEDEEELAEKTRKKKYKKSKKLSGAELGTLYHEVFEKLCYTGDYSDRKNAEAALKNEIERLISGGFIRSDVLENVSLKSLTAFALSPVGQRMVKAYKENRLFREQAFVYGLSNEEYRKYSKDERDTDMVMLQGVIDAYIEEDDGLVLIDYKTDRVENDAAAELTEKYAVQLELYALALSKLRKKPVKEKIIYSVAADKEVNL